MPFPVAFHPEGTDLKSGVFAQNEFIWNERLTIIPACGSTGTACRRNRRSPAARRATTQPVAQDRGHYKLNDTVAVFGSIAHTERFPTIDEVFSTSSSASTFRPNLGLKKERSNNFEAGFALSGADMLQAGDSGQVKVTGFYNDVKDLIALNPR